MIELAVLKSVVDLFTQLLSIIDRGTKNRREIFERTCKPLYDRLELVAKEYYGAIQDAAARLERPNQDVVSILHDLRARRANLIISRNGVIGEAQAFSKPFGPEGPSHLPYGGKGQFAELATSFAMAITGYFYDSERVFHYEGTITTGLISDLEFLVESRGKPLGKHDRPNLQSVLNDTKDALVALERQWTVITERYTQLKFYCET